MPTIATSFVNVRFKSHCYIILVHLYDGWRDAPPYPSHVVFVALSVELLEGIAVCLAPFFLAPFQFSQYLLWFRYLLPPDVEIIYGNSMSLVVSGCQNQCVCCARKRWHYGVNYYARVKKNPANSNFGLLYSSSVLAGSSSAYGD